LWTALYHPEIFLFGLVIFIGVMIWLLPKLWRGITKLINSIKDLFQGNSTLQEPGLIKPPDSMADG
jgi:hypothetical protein